MPNPWIILLDIIGWTILGGVALVAVVVIAGLCIGITQAVQRSKAKGKNKRTTIL
jgi:hypothetical protein